MERKRLQAKRITFKAEALRGSARQPSLCFQSGGSKVLSVPDRIVGRFQQGVSPYFQPSIQKVRGLEKSCQGKNLPSHHNLRQNEEWIDATH